MSDQDSRDESPALRESPDSGQDPDPNEDDLAALDAFCAQVDFTDVDFSVWQEANQSLDIQITEKISADEAQAGGERSISFTRTICKLDSENRLSRRNRERVTLTFNWPPGIHCPYRISIGGKGDQRGNQHGRVIIELLLKK